MSELLDIAQEVQERQDKEELKEFKDAKKRITKEIKRVQFSPIYKNEENKRKYIRFLADMQNIILNDEGVTEILNSLQKNNLYDELGNINEALLAQHIANSYTLRSDINHIYKYNTKFYVREEDFFTIVKTELEANTGKITDLRTRFVNEVEAQTKELTKIKDEYGSPVPLQQTRGYINFKNGLFNLNTGKLEPHNKDVFTTGCINAKYIEKFKGIQGTKFESFINSSLNSEYARVLGEMIGVSIYPITDKLHYFYVLLGSGRNGKSVLLNLIKNMLPSQWVGAISLENIGRRGSNGQLATITCNICADDETVRMQSLGILKSLSSNDSFNIEEKYKNPQQIRPFVTHISSFNCMPSMQEKQNAIWERAKIIKFKKSFGTAEEVERGTKQGVINPNLENELKEELDIIATYAVNCLVDLLNRGKFTITEGMKEANTTERLKNDTVRAWIEEEVLAWDRLDEPKTHNYLSVTELHSEYKMWMKDNGVPVGRTTFANILEEEAIVQNWRAKKISRQQKYAIKTRNHGNYGAVQYI